MKSLSSITSFTAVACLLLHVLGQANAHSAVVLASVGALDQVQKFDSVTGASLGVFASGIGSPSGIAFDVVNGSVFVADFGADNIRKYSASGSLIGNFGSGLAGPDELTVDSSGNVYVANYNGFNVKKFSSSGVLLATFDTGGRPEGMGFASNGDLLVNIYTGTNANTIRRYNPVTGAFISIFASGMTNPLGMAQDGAGNVYVANFTAGTLFKYSPGGALIDSAALGFLGYDLVINDLGQLLVSDSGASRIMRYDLDLNSLGTFATLPSGPTNLAIIPEPSLTILGLIGFVASVLHRRRS